MSLDCKDTMYAQVEELVSRFAADAGLVGLKSEQASASAEIGRASCRERV